MVDHDMYVMVQSDGFVGEWTYLIRTSTDGVSWSDPEQLTEPATGVELLYLTLSSPDLRAPGIVHGDIVHLYRMRSLSYFDRWAEAVLERIPLTLGDTPAGDDAA